MLPSSLAVLRLVKQNHCWQTRKLRSLSIRSFAFSTDPAMWDNVKRLKRLAKKTVKSGKPDL
jgi:hypothetical protein